MSPSYFFRSSITKSINTKQCRIEHEIVTKLLVFKVWSTYESKTCSSSVTHVWNNNHIAFADHYVFLFIISNNQIHYHMFISIYVATVSRAGTMMTSDRKSVLCD